MFPNGVGFGGQLDYFGLWIDASFEKGHSKGSPRSTTYGNPPLAVEEEFYLDYGMTRVTSSGLMTNEDDSRGMVHK